MALRPELIILFGGLITIFGGGITLYGTHLFNQQRARSQAEVVGQITGGDSFCYLKVLPQGDSELVFVVLHVGEYAISDVYLRFVDSDRLSGPNPPGVSSLDRMLEAQKDVTIGTLPVSGSRLVGRIQLPAGLVEKSFLASFTARNGSWDEEIRLRRSASGEWRVALKVNETSGQTKFADLNKHRKLRFHEIDTGFPTQSDHEIRDWLKEEARP